MGRNKYISCGVCSKTLRYDNLKRHQAQHGVLSRYPIKSCSICHKAMIAWHLPRHMKVHDKSRKQVYENIKADQLTYDDIVETGQIVNDVLVEVDNINPNSLRKEYKMALEINSLKKEKMCEALKSWQGKVLDLMKPTEREIIWISGRKGAEGKSWFQEYIEQCYGSKRVFRSTMSKNEESILHCLSKRAFSLIDVFVFNIPRSFNVKDVSYKLLEEIKDGQAISSKYNSKVLEFKKPNILIVFSNFRPYRSEVSQDRWKIYDIRKDELHVNCSF